MSEQQQQGVTIDSDALVMRVGIQQIRIWQLEEELHQARTALERQQAASNGHNRLAAVNGE